MLPSATGVTEVLETNETVSFPYDSDLNVEDEEYSSIETEIVTENVISSMLDGTANAEDTTDALLSISDASSASLSFAKLVPFFAMFCMSMFIAFGL